MKKRNPQDLGGTTIDAEAYNTIFIDTSLGTNFALRTDGSDIVSNLMDKIALEHRQFFPEIGEVKIHAVKVKRKGIFYHLSHNMAVTSAFEGSKKSWFIYVNISICNDPNQRAIEIGNTSLDTQKIKAIKLNGSDVDSQPQRDGQEKMSSSNVENSQQKRKSSLPLHEQAPLSFGSTNNVKVSEPSDQNAESEKECASSRKGDVTEPPSICNTTPPAALLVTKEAKTHESDESNRTKRSRISRSSDENCSSKVDVNVLEENLLTKIVDADHSTEELSRNGKKTKENKVLKSGAAAENQQNSESIVAENDLEMEQVSKTKLSSNGLDVHKAVEVNEATEDANTIGENKMEQKAESSVVARVEEIADMNREAAQINDNLVALDSLDPDDSVLLSANFKIYQRIEERELSVNSNVEALSREMPSYRSQNEPVTETVSPNMSTATVADEQSKTSGSRLKLRT